MVPLPFDRRRDIRHLFPTQMGRFQVPNAAEINPRIAEAVLAREAKSNSLSRSNKGGWHSDDHLLQWPELQFAGLADIFRSAVSNMVSATSGFERFSIDMTMGAWANVNRSCSYNSSHIHPQHMWSGVYYVQVPDLSQDPMTNAGHIEFQDPRGPVAMLPTPGQKSAFSMAPKEGLILIFPSWLYHSVNSFSLDVVRISLAFNARINKFLPQQ